MIPVRLQVRNFLSYRDNVPPLDFAGIHVACLSGANGHGKAHGRLNAKDYPWRKGFVGS